MSRLHLLLSPTKLSKFFFHANIIVPTCLESSSPPLPASTYLILSSSHHFIAPHINTISRWLPVTSLTRSPPVLFCAITLLRSCPSSSLQTFHRSIHLSATISLFSFGFFTDSTSKVYISTYTILIVLYLYRP